MSTLTYPINEIFATVQGEAIFTGMPSIFIRLQGCNVGCPWCDTKHTWGIDLSAQMNFLHIINKENDKSSWANVTIPDLIKFMQKKYPQIKHIVITGGEPAMYDLTPLCEALEELGKDIQIETSGTEKLRISKNTWVSLSPKIDMPGGKLVLEECVARANEIKMPIGKMADITKLKTFLKENSVNPAKTPIWLQPLSQSPTATKLSFEQALLNNWRLSLQTHKFISIR